MPDSTPSSAHWHTLTPEQALSRLQSDQHRGLSRDQAESRLKKHGANRLPSPPRTPAWLRFLFQFHNVLIYVMLGGAIITATLEHWVDTSVLLGAVVINAIIGFIQEGKAQKALVAIRQMLSLRSLVLRDGERIDIPAESLVPGDIVMLASGDKVPADVRLLSAKGLHLNESILTGESEVVEKSVDSIAADAALGDRDCMLYSGTLVASGQGVGVVVATGGETELGRISAMLEQVHEVTTPLLRQMAVFSRWLTAVILLLAGAGFMLGVFWRGHAPEDMLMMVVALAASAIPEGLPAIMTITLAIGVRRMAHNNAIIRHLPAVETLGAVTVICSDKTGTLTRNEMTVQRVITAHHVYDVHGIGYAPEGNVHTADGQPVGIEDAPELAVIARAIALCNDAELHRDGESWHLDGDPTEGALLTLTMKTGLDPVAERGAYPRTDVIPFESEHRLMATLHHDHENRAHIFIKGAPERLMDMCDRQEDGKPVDIDYWHGLATDAASHGMRLLAIATKPAEGVKRDLNFSDIASGCTLLALVGIMDPPREEARASVTLCRNAGIKVKMITGDHIATASAIGAQLGIGTGRPAMTGTQIEAMDDTELRKAVTDTEVFARSSPEHKLRLVEALQANGEIVAMTGDGVNDAPALKRADVGVAMGRKGTEAAKEAAAMVLTDDNFATIGNAVREGRGIYDNIRKFVLFMLPTNGGEGLVVMAAILFELVLPLTPAQVLWINLITSTTLGLALAFERPEHDVMRRKPRKHREPLLTWLFAWRVIMVSLLMMIGTLGLFLWELGRGSSLETARTMAVCTVVVAEMFYLLNSRHTYRSVLSREGLFGNRYVLLALVACAVLQLAFTYAPPFQQLFGSTGLSADEWLRVILAGLLVFAIAEIEKTVIRWLRRKPGHQHASAPSASKHTL